MATPIHYLDAESLLNNRCASLSREDLSSFFVIIRDVPPEAPGDLQTDFYFSKDEESK